MSTAFTLSDYLLCRLKEFGIKHLFGVPGDYAFPLLERVEADADIAWTGNCNEHNAGMAADGYARSNGFAALVTTCGPGEMGAASAIGGSYAEQIPVIIIVGHPPQQTSPGYRPTHHSLNGDFSRFARIFGELTAAHAELAADTACADIDHVLTTAWTQRRPGWIAIPKDLQTMPVARPAGPLALPAARSDPAQLDAFIAAATAVLDRAKQPAILADVGVGRYQLTPAVEALVAATGMPLALVLSAVSAGFDETRRGFIGTYSIAFKDYPAYPWVESADALLRIGVQRGETNTGRADLDWAPPFVIDLQLLGASVGNQTFPGVTMADALRRLEEGLPLRNYGAPRAGYPTGSTFAAKPGAPMTADAALDGIASFLREGDVLVVDQGSISAAQFLPKPAEMRVLSQYSWASIGYGMPMLLGSLLAAPDQRHVLVVGDGGLQMTAQELSTILRHQLAPVIFVFDNAAYLIENFVGVVDIMDNRYNDLVAWDYARLPEIFAPGGRGIGIRVETEDEYAAALRTAAQAQSEGHCVLIDIRLPHDSVSKISRLLNAPTLA